MKLVGELRRKNFHFLEAPAIAAYFGIWALYFIFNRYPANHDDAFIFIVYSKNLILGNGLVFNLNDYVWGYTSPLYTLLLAAAGLLHESLISVSFLLGLFSNVLSGIALLYFCRTLFPKYKAFLFCAVFLTWWRIMFWLQLESALLLALQLWFLVTLTKDRPYLSAFLGALSCLARPDSIVFVVPFLFFKFRFAQFSRALVVFGIPGLIWVLFAFVYYGTILPQPFYAKKAMHSFQHHFVYAFGELVGVNRKVQISGLDNLITSDTWISAASIIFILLSLSLLFCPEFRERKFLRYLVFYPWVLLCSYSLIGAEPGHSWEYASAIYFFRFTVLLGAANVWRIFINYSIRLGASPKIELLANTAVSLLLAAVLIWGVIDTAAFVNASHRLKYRGLRDSAYMEIGTWLNKNTAADESLLAWEVGTLRFYSDREIIDALGLVTKVPHFSENPLPYILLELRPDYVLRYTDNPKYGMPKGQFWEPVPGAVYERLKRFNTDFVDATIYKRQRQS